MTLGRKPPGKRGEMRVLLRICWSREKVLFLRCRYFIWCHEAEIRRQGSNCTKFLQWPKNRETVKVKQNSRRWRPGDHSVTNVCYVCISKDFTFMSYPQKSWPLWSGLVILAVRYIDRIPRACWPGGMASLVSPGSHWETWHCLRNKVNSSTGMTPKLAFALICIWTLIQNTKK